MEKKKVEKKKKELQLEVNPDYIPKSPGFNLGGLNVMITPPIGEDYWCLRVKLTNKQSIIGFTKFSTIGIGFAVETDWNTNLPYQCDTEEIYNHIEHNRGDSKITKAMCLEAIKMIQTASKKMKEDV